MSLYELNNVQQYYDGIKILNIDSLILEENQIIGFFGPNGSGKSTLFSLLSFSTLATNGDITYNGINDKKIDFETKKNIVMVPQNPYLLKRTVFENIAYGLKIRGKLDNINEKVEEALILVGLDPSFGKRKWSQLSGGEAQRVALASRLILKPKVLILDEPTTGVDTNSSQLIKDAILIAKQKYNTTILISSHDHNWLNHICDRKIALFQGNIVENGNVNLLFSPWEKNEAGNLVKFFIDGQKLTIPNTNNKKRDSVLVIDSNNIEICRSNCEGLITEDTLIGTISSIQQEKSLKYLLIEFIIGGVTFNCRVTRNEMEKQRLLPSDRIYVNINFDNICWI